MAAHRVLIALALVGLATPAMADPTTAGPELAPAASVRPTAICIDQEIADRLAIKRKRRKVLDRLFVKQGRHEFTASGGYYVSDLFSATWVAGGAYTYHMTESTAVELAFAFTHENADAVRAIEDGRATVLADDYAVSRFVESVLVLTPIYGKLRLGGAIARFDLHADLGVGVVEAQTSRGTAGVAGLGMKLFVGPAGAVRLDARDRIFRQELLDEHFLVNDLSLTLGLSLFLPVTN